MSMGNCSKTVVFSGEIGAFGFAGAKRVMIASAPPCRPIPIPGICSRHSLRSLACFAVFSRQVDIRPRFCSAGARMWFQLAW
ncbi:hypothetical protein Saro_3245 [Novosphingobium aromaticivorans DSM 12444]|uniref:Uncharacterized protein n=1 Tax=Novosphingobium aromaticivorans (strain ATCC 700278 / DSM 12444 / CCUG 56034 / CIP 105152 / NBRC 16084 / F199) TaxID=279238 RepID=Q2G393_NOVAD|nr:hypothetical protein Saro_3245 [Novosphingobium aromaticivorans DSM 12444]